MVKSKNKIFGKKNRLQHHAHDLKFLANSSHDQRKRFLKSKSKSEMKSLINCLSDLAHSLLFKEKFVEQLSKDHRDNLRTHHLSDLKKLSGKSSHQNKRTFISSQKGGSFLGALWNGIKLFFKALT